MDQAVLREEINRAYFADEALTVHQRREAIRLDHAARRRITDRAEAIVRRLRTDPTPNLMETFLAEYGLSTDEGVALMCLAEAYLRVPDAPTLDALIRDKIGGADWSKHAGETDSLLVSASTWALMLTGRIFRNDSPAGPQVAGTLRRLVQRVGEPVVRSAVAQAMKVMGQQFVLGRTIEEAIRRGESRRAKGYRFSYDMLGEAARTGPDAKRYWDSYAAAIDAIARHADARAPVHDNPGISVKLSALHPRYEATQRDRVLAELVPSLHALAVKARAANIGFNIDAEEADRLSLSLDVIERVLESPDLAGWDGFGVVVQAYSKQCLPVLRWVRALADRLDRKLAVRLVKGAYWDSEIKNSQVLGLPGYPVFTRKTSTDVSYLAGARFLLDNRDRLYPQFATHNAQTAAAVLEMAGNDGGGFEFQRLHGMGQALHDRLLEEAGRPCRIYAPVGVHKDLLAYLVRRLLENGANSSFVHQLLDEDVPPDVLVRDPIAATESAAFIPNPRIPLPPDLFDGERRNSAGWNLNNPVMEAEVEAGMAPFRTARWTAAPLVGGSALDGEEFPVLNPADRADRVGTVRQADKEAAGRALEVAAAAFPAWRDRAPADRAAILDRIADLYEASTFELMAILTREAGKTRMDGVLEVREAVDFCRYYAAQARRTPDGSRGQGQGLGPFVCISPWNFPLAIFTGQVVAALVAGNTVIAKPAEQTPLVAARAVALMIEAGVPPEVLSLLPGDGATVGAALTADPRTAGVCFTGSTETAILIDRALATHGSARAPLIAETGGLNAMIVDSTALVEHAVRDIVNSAFQSAGQRCSALRAVFVQSDIRDHLLAMLEGAAMELRVGDPWNPATDVGPVIDAESRGIIEEHCRNFAKAGRVLFRHPLPGTGGDGLFVAPTAIALDRFDALEREIFGPVLHVVPFEAHEIDRVVDAVNARGYGLTLGIHSRLDDRVEEICRRARVGNIYVNRNQIGAVVGVQPFGGEGLSGTGPKAGGPHYLARFTRPVPASLPAAAGFVPPAGPGEGAGDAAAFATAARLAGPDWDARTDRAAVLGRAAALLPAALRPTAEAALAAASPAFAPAEPLPGPTGESNHLTLHGRGIALCLGGGPDPAGALAAQAFLALAAGNAAALAGSGPAAGTVVAALRKAGVPDGVAAAVTVADAAGTLRSFPGLGVVAFEGTDAEAVPLRRALAERDGRRVPLASLDDGVERFATERVVSIDTTASGGNASLLTLGDG
ncbi:bifunctional proline dehydrogenase/L-glutamate gamma-semialdehyde dehydrogenase PutA [Skermanella rosea]|uniref:bifunctional proline dehydrogenase/L-glutamate gamma-semialdehyde dehydrogenase PutA n=1 Tax=Skermanella rosea TaxID=1817965 RepID=UPI0019349FD6|nr:bifunctional proline dehydrogenase/L-glutamate gamma-semialdehyde dehydrogenase PutA [Skermanella rosea]UEM03737.1 bifunctional proline dehydrogenase/L-glutamate gamma-semialdehyde dehydrogenase PutA [Skermanella rosea]